MIDELFIFYNIDILMNERNIEIYMIEYFNIINLSILSSHEFKFKIDVSIILLHNFN